MNSEIGERLKTLVAKNQLSPEEIDELADAALAGYFGNGSERKYSLGKWYDIVQTMVNARVMTAVRLPPVKKTPIFCRLRRGIICRRKCSK